MADTLHIYAQIEPETVVKRPPEVLEGRVYPVGVCAIEVMPEWLQGLSERQRAALLKAGRGKYPHGHPPFTPVNAIHSTCIAEATLDAVRMHLDSMIEAEDAAAIADAKRNAENDARDAQRVEAWLALDPEERLQRSDYRSPPTWRVRPLNTINSTPDEPESWKRFGAAYPELVARYAAEVARLEEFLPERNEAERVEAERVEAERAEAAAVAAAEREREREQYETERAEWIEGSGSERLRALAAEGFALDRTYREERMALDFPMLWEWFDEICGKLVPIRDPSLDAVQALRKLRASRPEATPELAWLADGGHLEDCEHERTDEYGDPCEEFVPGPCLSARFLGRTIIKRL
jgi:hypothetical protein